MKINKLKLAVAGAVLATASVANAGIIIPAGDWTLDINGNVNTYVNYTKSDNAQGSAVIGGLATAKNSNNVAAQNPDKALGINTGLLPAWLGFSGSTRQNDVDVSFTISMQPNTSDNTPGGDNNAPLFRQAFLQFGDKSWGSIKLGKDIGIFAHNAILNDMTLLGVGAVATPRSGGATTFGGIGSGYIYAAWKGQATYTTPNFNGLTASVGIFNPNAIASSNYDATTLAAVATGTNQDRFGFEGQIQYAFNQNDVSGKIWASGATYDVTLASATATYTAVAGDIGANINAGAFGLTGYYYGGSGAGTTYFGQQGVYAPDAATKAKRDSDGGYIQVTYTAPFKTKFGVAYGISNLDAANATDLANNARLVAENERWTVGAYHPLTKHLNLVAEYNNIKSQAQVSTNSQEASTYSAGAILFF